MDFFPSDDERKSPIFRPPFFLFSLHSVQYHAALPPSDTPFSSLPFPLPPLLLLRLPSRRYRVMEKVTKKILMHATSLQASTVAVYRTSHFSLFLTHPVLSIRRRDTAGRAQPSHAYPSPSHLSSLVRSRVARSVMP